MKRVILPWLGAALLALAACDGEPATPPQPPPPSTSAEPVAPPPPADPAPVADGDITVGYAHGIKVIVKRLPGADLAAIQLYVRGGARTWTAADAGIQRLALQAAVSGGTKSLDKDTFARKLASLGSEINAGTRGDFSSIDAKMLKAHWEETLSLMADTLLHPAMPEKEIELQRGQQLAALTRETERPDSHLGLLVHKEAYRGHPLENRSIGTAESVKALKPEALNEHLAKLRETSRLLLVAAGDLDANQVIEKTKALFAGVPRGSYVEAPYPAVHFDKARLLSTERKIETNYIEAFFPSPRVAEPDYADGLVTMSMLRHRLFEEVRTKRNLSYAPGAGAGGGGVPLGYLYVTAVDPTTTFRVMLDEVKKLQNEKVSDKELLGTKSTFLTHHLMESESTNGQATMVAMAEILGGDYKLSRTLPDRVRAVTPDTVMAFAKKHLGKLQVVYLGDPSKADKALFESL